MTYKAYDVRIDDRGPVILFYPMSPAGSRWCDENLPDTDVLGRLARIVPEMHARMLIHGLINDGLTVGSAVAV